MSSSTSTHNNHFVSIIAFRVYSFGKNYLREREWIDLGRFEGEIYVVLFEGFRGDVKVDLGIKFVKICEGFD